MLELFASVDLGGTNLCAALAGADGQVLAEAKQPTRSHEGPEAVLNRMAGLINQLATQTGTRPKAAGIGVPGLVDLAAGTTKFLPNLSTHWQDVPVRDHLQPLIGCPVFLLNDARAATLGELVFGLGRTVRTMVFFGIGTGIGGGVVVDRQLRLGPLGAAGELGHHIVQKDGRLCGCGSRGCLETLVSGPALSAEGVRLLLTGQAPILHKITTGAPAQVTPSTMGQAARAGETCVLSIIERAGEWLGIAASNLITALHPELIIIGGGVAELGDLLLNPVRQTIRQCVRMLPTDSVRVERSQLGDKAGLLGGIALAMNGGVQVTQPGPAPA
jgi:glucokinase